MSVVVTVAGYAHLAFTDATEEIAGKLLDQTSNAVAARVERHLLPAASLADLASALPTVAQPPDLLVHPVAWQLMRAVSEYRSVYSAYIGFADGRFYQIISLDAVEGRARVLHSAPATARYLQRAVLSRADGRLMQVWSYLGQDRRLMESWVDEEFDYDPRKRPWYVSAMAAEHQIMTGLYTFHSLGLPGFSLAQRFDGDVPGVFGVDITFEDLSRYLQLVLPSPNSRMTIFDEAGSILAAPGYSSEFKAVPGSPMTLVLTAADLGDPAMAELIRRAPYKGSLQGVTQSTEVRHLFSVTHIDAGPAAHLHVGLVAPVSDFVAPLERMRLRGLAFLAFVLLVGVPIVYVIANRMSRALLQLAGEAARIQRLDLSGDTTVRTFVKEINLLAEAVATMRTSLRVFGVYVPKDLVSQVLATKGSLTIGGVRRELTIMFSDVEAFTALAEHSDPEDLMRWTSMLFQEVGEAVANRHGIVDKYIGDSVMAIWNAPQLVDRHAGCACRAALEALVRSRALCDRLAGEGFPPMRTRFAVHTGDAVVGNMGSPERMNYTALGATVNTASRLERLAKRYNADILVSGQAARAAGSDFVFRLLDVVVPVGSEERLVVHQLIGLAPGSAEADLPQATPEDVEFCRRFDEAQKILRDRRDLKGAAAAFRELASERPDDQPAALMAARLAELAAAPEIPWADITVMSEK